MTGAVPGPAVLVCAPFAGAGPSFFRPWQRLAGDRLDILPLALPGRERRIEEPPYRAVGQAADGLLPGLLDRVRGGRPVVLFGHSLGAVLGYELARRLAAEPAVRLAGLVVSGSPGPWTHRDRRATGLPDREFLRRVREFAGYSHEALDDPELRELILPALRADVAMHEDYRPGTRAPLPVPITSVRGRADTLVGAAQAGEWAAATTVRFALVEVDGGHMYLVDRPAEVLAAAGGLAGEVGDAARR